MVLVRRLDTEATALQRQGELGLWASSLGQEAAQVGSAAGPASGRLRLPDVPRPRRDVEQGRPAARDPRDVPRRDQRRAGTPTRAAARIYTIVIGNQALHGVGYAMGIQLDGTDDAVIAYFGDGATAEGDVNEALRLRRRLQRARRVLLPEQPVGDLLAAGAAAIAVPLYERAAGFGFPGVQVDGNDILAVIAVTREALERARDRRGPDAHRGVHLSHGRPHDVGRSHALPPRRGARDLAPARSDRAAEGLPGPAGHRRPALLRPRRPRGGRTRRPRARRRARDARARGRRRCSTMSTPSRIGRSSSSGAGFPRTRPPSRTGRRSDDHDDGQGHQRRTAQGDGARSQGPALRRGHRPARWRLPRSPTDCRRTSASIGSSTPRSPRAASSARRWAWRCAATDRCARSSSTASCTRPSTRSCRRWPRCTVAPRALCAMPIVIRIPYGGGIGAVEHHSESPEAYFAHTAGLRVLTPSDPQAAYVTIQQAIACDDPVVFFEPKRRYWDKGEVDESFDVSIPVRSRTRGARGSSAPGPTSPSPATGRWCAPASRPRTAATDVDLEVIDLQSLSPLDIDTVVHSVERTGRLVVVHEASANVRHRCGDRGARHGAVLLLARGARPAGHRLRRPLPAEPPGGALPARPRPRPRRRRPGDWRTDGAA